MSSTPLSFTAAQQTLQLDYKNTILYTERQGVKTSGLDAQGVRPAQPGFPSTPTADPAMPIPSSSFSHLSLDLEGLVLNADGSSVSTLIYLRSYHLTYVETGSGLATNTDPTSTASTVQVLSFKQFSLQMP